jgi:hypothetical protein
MKITVQVVIQADNERVSQVSEIACFKRDDLTPATLGLTLTESKQLLGALQETFVAQQVTAYNAQQQECSHCQAPLSRKSTEAIVMRTLFGKVTLNSPRFYICACQADQGKQSFSPLAECLSERSTPELLYLQSKWAALMSYGLTVERLSDVLPVEISHTSLQRQVNRLAERCEQELGEEQPTFIEGCLRDWNALPTPEAPLTVGLDGGYLQGRHAEKRKAGSFEVIVGKSLSEERPAKCFGFVNGYDDKPRRRVFETLRAQGLQMNQDITFLSDGGDTVRDLQFYLSPLSEHFLDWFHITMRLTVMQQLVKGLSASLLANHAGPDLAHDLDRVKWFLWHGNTFKALQTLEYLQMEVEALQDDETIACLAKLLKALEEFYSYIDNNQDFIPNYGERYRYGEIISTAFVESTVNHVLSKRFVKKQQMRWTLRGAHLLLQVRLQVINQDWRRTFQRWYPGISVEPQTLPLAA